MESSVLHVTEKKALVSAFNSYLSIGNKISEQTQTHQNLFIASWMSADFFIL